MIARSRPTIVGDSSEPLQLILPFPLRLVVSRAAMQAPRARQRLGRSVRHDVSQLSLLELIVQQCALSMLTERIATNSGALSDQEEKETRRWLASGITEDQRRGLYRVLLSRLDPLLISEARRLAGPAHCDQEDLSQEARLIVWQAMPRLDPSRPILPYLLGALRRGLPRSLNRTHRLIRIPERQMRRVCQLWRMIPRAEVEALRVSQIADLLGISHEQGSNVRIALDALSLTDSTFEHLREDELPDSSMSRQDEDLSRFIKTRDLLDALPEVNRALLLARYPLDDALPHRTLAAAARLLGFPLLRAERIAAQTRSLIQDMT